MTDLLGKLITAVLSLGAVIGYVRGRLNGLFDRVDKLEEQQREQDTKWANCPARIQTEAEGWAAARRSHPEAQPGGSAVGSTGTPGRGADAPVPPGRCGDVRQREPVQEDPEDGQQSAG